MHAFRARRILILLALSVLIACDSPTRPNPQSPGSPLVVPVTGTWHVLKGPPCPNANNHHCNVPNQQFALDLIAVDPITLAAVSCFGMPILSPSNGQVVDAVDGLPDLPIGQTDPSNPAGNHVVIRRSDAEYLILAHMAQGSVAVAPGAVVTAGQKLGTCGNSGNTAFPHLHVHMQTTPKGLEFSATGLPLVFGQVSTRNLGSAQCTSSTGVLLGMGTTLC